ncbi:MAG: hypothetical protein HUJ75_02860 [Parasporobacterium sp.]|nr:hypothetical protein [Parasporobacterium sp.]
MKTRKSLLCLLVALTMIISLFPVMASAKLDVDVIQRGRDYFYEVKPEEMFAGYGDPEGNGFNGDPDRGAFCQIFNANDSEPYIYNYIALKDGNHWGNWTELEFSYNAEGEKWLIEYDSNTKAYIITAVADQPLRGAIPEYTKWKSVVNILEDPPYVWDTYNEGKITHETDGAAIVIYSKKSDTNKDILYQRWRFYLSSDGRYIIRNAGSGQYVSFSNEKMVQKKSINDAYLFEIDRLSQKDKSNYNYYFGYTERWMENLPDDALLSSINIPGTHDTGTAHTWCSVGNIWWKDQILYFSEQLTAGVRYFDVRINPTSKEAMPEDVRITHFQPCIDRDNENLTLRTMWNQAIQFLDEHPSETIIFCVNTNGVGVDWEGAGHAMAKLIKEQLSEDRVVGGPQSTGHLWQGDTVPTVGEARGKIVLIRLYDLIKEEKPYGLNVTDFGLCTNGGALLKEGMEGGYAHASVTSSESYPVDPDFSTADKPVRIGKYVQDIWRTSEGDKETDIDNTFRQAAGLTEFPNGDGKVYFINSTNITGSCYIEETEDSTTPINKMIMDDENGYLTGNYFTGIVNFNYINTPITRRIYNTNFTGTNDFFVYSVKNAEVTCGNGVYTGDKVTPEVTVKVKAIDKVNGGTKTVTLTKDVDYTVEYDNNIIPSDKAGYTITGIGKYAGTQSGTFTIEKIPAEITVMDNPTKEYDGMSVFPPSNKTNATDHKMSYIYYDAEGNELPGEPVNVGHYSVVIKVSDSAYTYDGQTDPIEFDILPKDLTLYLNSFKNTDDGSAGVICKASGFLSGDVEGSIRFTVNSTEYVVDLDANGQAVLGSDSIAEGNYNVTASYIPGGNGNYTADDANANYDKALGSRQITLTSEEISKTYSESDNKIDLTDYVNTDYTTGSDSWTYTIEKDLITARFPNLPATAVFSPDDPKGTLTVENAGVVKVKISLVASGVYNECQAEITVKITRGDLTVSTSAYKDDPDTQGGKIPVTTATYGDLEGIRYEISAVDSDNKAVDVTTDDFTNSHGYLEAVPLSEETDAGTASIEIRKVGTGSINFRGTTYNNLFLCRNYNLVFTPGSITVNPASVTIKADNAVGYYNGKEPSYSCTVEGLTSWDSADDVFDSLSAGLETGKTYAGLVPDEYDIIPEGTLTNGSNYKIDSKIKGKLTVKKGDPKLQAVPGTEEKIYDGEAVIADCSVVDEINKSSVSLKWSVYDSSSKSFVAMSGNPVNVGYYRLTAELAESDNFISASAYCNVVIGAAGQEPPTVVEPELTYNGKAQSLGSVTPGKYGKTVYYSLDEPIDPENLKNYSVKPPTATEAGTYEVYYYISSTDSNHINLTDSYPAIIKEDPQWLTDAEQVWIKGSTEDLVFRSSAPYSTYVRTLWNGTELSEENFEASEGSTIITLKASYLNTLKPGTYKLTIASHYASLDGSVIIKEPDPAKTTDPAGTTTAGGSGGGSGSGGKNANTGDNSMMSLWVVLLALSAAGITVAAVTIKKKSGSRK